MKKSANFGQRWKSRPISRLSASKRWTRRRKRRLPSSAARAANGQQLAGGVGCQLILRRGAASCYSGMVNLSSGETLSHGQAVAANNLYLVGTEGCGFIASETCAVLVNGAYTLQ